MGKWKITSLIIHLFTKYCSPIQVLLKFAQRYFNLHDANMCAWWTVHCLAECYRKAVERWTHWVQTWPETNIFQHMAYVYQIVVLDPRTTLLIKCRAIYMATLTGSRNMHHWTFTLNLNFATGMWKQTFHDDLECHKLMFEKISV